MFRVLIVDDEPFVLESLKANVPWSQERCAVIGTATSGAEALQKAAALHPDLVFTDIRMPGMDGLELARRVQERHPNVPVVIVTGHANFSYAQFLPVLRQACQQRTKLKAQPLVDFDSA